MNISLGADERPHIVDVTLDYLKERGHDVTWYGPPKGDTQPWPEVARQVALDVQSADAGEGILFCWTGTGVCIAANKFKGIRAALCEDAETTRGARLWNNANVLCLSIRRTPEVVLKEILDMWFHTSYEPNETDEACLRIIDDIENHS
jgi:ribose 5-phosphate isomerase B